MKAIKYILIIAMLLINNLYPKDLDKEMNETKTIIFLGDSLTAGMGLISPDESYVSILANKLKKEKKSFKIINAGVSGDTTSGGLSRLDWVTANGVDFFILELGANDGMRGLKAELIENNLIQIIQRVKLKNSKVKILLIPMKAFPNMGVEYGKNYNEIFKRVADKEKIPLSPFLLENVAGIKNLNQSDGVHPTDKGHQIMAENIYPSLIKLISQ